MGQLYPLFLAEYNDMDHKIFCRPAKNRLVARMPHSISGQGR
jgi:hypothetical protein